ncbi:MAG: glycosyltransferase family 2 protein [Planctomycetota bacterium]
MAKVSVVICCADAAATLPAALASARWADEVLVVDSGSRDETARIAQEGADRYVVEPWRGYTAQKQFAVELARNDWIFILDGDEEVSPVLARQLASLREDQWEGLDVVAVRRQNWVMGRRVRAWFPDWQARLIHRRRAVWEDDALHDTCHPGHPSRGLKLSGHLEHKRVGATDWSDYFSGRRLDERLRPVAEQMYDRGKRASAWSLVLRPWGAFWKFYLIKRGFLDGTFGLLIAQKAAVSVQLKYAALWAVQQERAAAEAAPSGAAAERPL